MQYILAFAAALSMAATSPSATDPILEQYYLIHKSLAADTTAGVPAAASRLAGLSSQAAAGNPKLKEHLTAVSQAASRLQTTDLKAARNEFGELSKRMTAWLLAAGRGRPYQFYCSMANKGWLQQDKQTRNPYYGKSMLTCGDLLP